MDRRNDGGGGRTVDRITIYRAPTTVCDADVIASWIRERVEAPIDVRERFVDVYGGDELAEAFARARVRSPTDRRTGSSMLGVLRYEERALSNPDRAGGVLYDGLAVKRAFNDHLPPDERHLSHLHVVLLDRVLGTWGAHDGRWHKRVTVVGQPSIVSVPGLYEAPAKPEAYYQEKGRHALQSGDVPPREALERRIEGEFLGEDDPRTTDVLKGYVLQAAHVIETGEGFCEEPRCRLSNPHRQAGVIEAHLRGPAFCSDHEVLYAPGT